MSWIDLEDLKFGKDTKLIIWIHVLKIFNSPEVGNTYVFKYIWEVLLS